MMTEEVKKLYKGSIKNAPFLQEIYIADGDKKPGILSGDPEKALFSAIYYGWLIGRYKTDWRLHI